MFWSSARLYHKIFEVWTSPEECDRVYQRRDMKDYFTLLATYNAHVNEELYTIIGELPEADRNKKAGSYFGSIFGLLNHIYSSDCAWLLRFKEKLSPLPALESPLLGEPLPQRGAPMFKDFETLGRKRPELDAVIGRFVTELREENLTQSFSFVTRMSGERTLILWQALTHMFNHETHHRGAIAQILDELGVANDYSNLMSIL
jgi:uncharacterized damage-inducible protein DinB